MTVIIVTVLHLSASWQAGEEWYASPHQEQEMPAMPEETIPPSCNIGHY